MFCLLPNYHRAFLQLSLESSELTWSRNAIKVSRVKISNIPFTPEQLPFESKEPLLLLEWIEDTREETYNFDVFCETVLTWSKLSKVTDQKK